MMRYQVRCNEEQKESLMYLEEWKSPGFPRETPRDQKYLALGLNLQVEKI